MSENQETKEHGKTFFRQLIDRRVLQITGMYIGAGVGLIQFLDWIVNRYLLSPYLVELVLVILVSLLPSVLVIAYCHGAPGRNKRPTSERFLVPVNVILCIALCFFFFNGKDLTSISKKVTLKDETGKTTERIVPKSSFRKKTALFYFNNTTGDTSLDWLQYGALYMLELDLNQDIFIDIRSPHSPSLDGQYEIYAQIKAAGYKNALKMPLLLKKKIALESQRNTFLSGEISKEGSVLSIEYTLHRSRDAKTLARRSFSGDDIFQLIDDISLRLKKDLDIPSGHLDNVTDLPIGEIFTRSLPAARLFVRAQNTLLFERNWRRALQLLEQAVKEDPGFVAAHQTLGGYYTANNQPQKAKAAFENALKLNYKVPERQQFIMKAVYFGIQNKLDKAISLFKMHLKLYPEDVIVHSLLALYNTGLKRTDEALASYLKILEIDPLQYPIYLSIGKLYEDNGQYKEALKHYQTAARHLPNSVEPFTATGTLNEKLGNFEAARAAYEKALLLNPRNINALVTLTSIQYKSGRFGDALKQLHEALDISQSSKEKTQVYQALKDFHAMKGQMKKSLEYEELLLESMADYTLPILLPALKASLAISCSRAGLESRALDVLKDMKKQLKPPLDKIIPRAYMQVYLELGRPGEAEKQLRLLEALTDGPLKASMQFYIDRGRGQILEMRGQYPGAIENYNRALKTQPDSRGSQLAGARCLRKLKRFDDAEERLTGILSKNPYHPKYNLEAALLYLDMGNKDKARHHLKRALEAWKDADPDYAPAQEAQKTMAALQE